MPLSLIEGKPRCFAAGWTSKVTLRRRARSRVSPQRRLRNAEESRDAAPMRNLKIRQTDLYKDFATELHEIESENESLD